MPLEHSKSKAAVGRNIKRELEAGKPLKQAEAIALSTQRSSKDQLRQAIAAGQAENTAQERAAALLRGDRVPGRGK